MVAHAVRKWRSRLPAAGCGVEALRRLRHDVGLAVPRADPSADEEELFALDLDVGPGGKASGVLNLLFNQSFIFQ